MNRSDFLKLLGAGATVVALGRFASTSLFDNGKNGSQTQASAQSSNPWAFGPNASVVAVHAVLLTNGKLLLVQGSGNHLMNKSGPFTAALHDPDLGNQQTFSTSDDLFCAGQNHLANGNVLITGGTKKYDVDTPNGQFEGLNSVYEYSVSSNTFTKLTNLAAGKWYPTQLVLADGKVMNLGGLDDYGMINELTEVYDPVSKTHSIVYDPASSRTYCVGAGSGIPGSGTPCYGGPNRGTFADFSLYPRMHLMPSGQVLLCGSSNHLFSWNPSNGHYAYLGNTILPNWRAYGTSFLLPLNNTAAEKGTVLIVGGNPDGNIPATRTCEILDFNTSPNPPVPVIKSTGLLNVGRTYPMPVILPTGQIIVFGGTTGLTTNYVYSPEMYDPVSGQWTLLNTPAKVGRTYHSLAVLLPDGRVWTAGGTPSPSDWEPRTEIYSPWYLSAGPRPTISGAPAGGQYNATISIPTPDAQNISKVSLLRLMAATHHYEPNQRLIWLQITARQASSITVSAPINANIAPPGPYMIHVLNNSGVPSKGSIIMIPNGASSGGAPPAVSITSPANNSQVPTGSVAFAGTASSGYPITKVELAMDGNAASYLPATPGSPGNWSTWSINYNIPSGNHYLVARVTDNQGRQAWASVAVIGVSTTGGPPAVSITSPANNSQVVKGVVVFAGTASSGYPITKVELAMDGNAASYLPATPGSPGNWSTWSINYNIPSGSHWVVARVTDNQGRQAWASITVNAV